jgi:hypothetical protein
VDNSSASIPAISLVITAMIPARHHPGNEVRSELSIVAVKNQIETDHIPELYCKPFATTTKNTGNAVEWHRLVTRVQHNEHDPPTATWIFCLSIDGHQVARPTSRRSAQPSSGIPIGSRR